MDSRFVVTLGGLATVLLFSVCLLPGTDGACSCQGGGFVSGFAQMVGTGDYCCYPQRGRVGIPYCCDFDTMVENTTGLTIGAIVGIAIGCLVAVVLVFVFLCCCCGCCCFR